MREFNLDRNTPIQKAIAFFGIFVYIGSLFFPLMDKDAAHHANIALNMLQHHNWTDLIDRDSDYLDKPHLLFWTSLLSFKIFGVNTFAHRLPAVLFSLLSLFSTYKLARHLADRTTAKMALLILGTAQAFILSITDARMETPLTAFIVLGLWQLILYIDTKKLVPLLLAAFGSAMAFSTKGWLGPVIIFISVFFYIALHRKWKILLQPRTWIFIPVFLLLIAPVLYAYYVQFDLHPEKLIRGKDHRSGIHFILWDQLFERSQGFDQGHKGRNSDYFFLFHTFLWAFFPWSLFAYAAVYHFMRRAFALRKWNQPFLFAVFSFVFILVAISFSKFKMPHYIIMLLPFSALFTAPFLRWVALRIPQIRFWRPFQLSVASLVMAAATFLNFFAFPPSSIPEALLIILPALIFFALLLRKDVRRGFKVFYLSVALSLLVNFLMNYNFFPQLLQYQGGNRLADDISRSPDGKNIPDDQIVLLEVNAHSFDFYKGYNHKVVEIDSFAKEFPSLQNKYFLISSPLNKALREQGFRVDPVVYSLDYNVAVLKPKFLNPATRSQTLDTLMLARISRP